MRSENYIIVVKYKLYFLIFCYDKIFNPLGILTYLSKYIVSTKKQPNDWHLYISMSENFEQKRHWSDNRAYFELLLKSKIDKYQIY